VSDLKRWAKKMLQLINRVSFILFICCIIGFVAGLFIEGFWHVLIFENYISSFFGGATCFAITHTLSRKRSAKNTMLGFPPKEKLKRLTDLPQSSVGAPCPLIFATEHSLYVTFYLNQIDPNWDGTTVKVVDSESSGEPSIIVKFDRVTAHYFGKPNDEAISGHHLYSAGLEAYSYFEVMNSSWRDELEKMNRVHPYHKKAHYDDVHHFIFTFHDTTLEILARAYSAEITNLPLSDNMQRILNENGA
jgi:hypothetical protein